MGGLQAGYLRIGGGSVGMGFYEVSLHYMQTFYFLNMSDIIA